MNRLVIDRPARWIHMWDDGPYLFEEGLKTGLSGAHAFLQRACAAGWRP